MKVPFFAGAGTSAAPTGPTPAEVHASRIARILIPATSPAAGHGRLLEAAQVEVDLVHGVLAEAEVQPGHAHDGDQKADAGAVPGDEVVRGELVLLVPAEAVVQEGRQLETTPVAKPQGQIPEPGFHEGETVFGRVEHLVLAAQGGELPAAHGVRAADGEQFPGGHLVAEVAVPDGGQTEAGQDVPSPQVDVAPEIEIPLAVGSAGLLHESQFVGVLDLAPPARLRVHVGIHGLVAQVDPQASGPVLPVAGQGDAVLVGAHVDEAEVDAHVPVPADLRPGPQVDLVGVLVEVYGLVLLLPEVVLKPVAPVVAEGPRIVEPDLELGQAAHQEPRRQQGGPAEEVGHLDARPHRDAALVRELQAQRRQQETGRARRTRRSPPRLRRWLRAG